MTVGPQIRRLAEVAQEATSRASWGEAIQAYRSLVELAPISAVFNNLGLALASDGQLEAAATALETAHQREPSAAVCVNLGNVRRSMGDKEAARVAYRAAITLDETCARAFYNLHASIYEESAPELAIAALERARELRPDHCDTRFYLHALRVLHQRPTSDAVPASADFLLASLHYVRAHPEAALFADTFDTLRFALSRAPRTGAVIELGVRRGTTLRYLAGLVAGPVHGFDSFEGLPAAWGDQPAGLYTAGGALPSVPEHVALHRGLFADTIPAFAPTLTEPLRFVHVDCDLYASTRDALVPLKPHLKSGTVIVFDEYLCNPGWQHEEHLAFTELALPYRYLAFSLFTKQAAVQVL